MTSLCAIGLLVWGCCCANYGARRYGGEEYAALTDRPNLTRLAYQGYNGETVSYYVGEITGAPPRFLLLVYPGISSRALDFLWLADRVRPDGGTILLDYPGRGKSEGLMDPLRLYETSEGALGEVAKLFHVAPESFTDLRAVGHSFGTAAALQFAARDARVGTLVLLAPMSSLGDAAVARLGWLAHLLPDSRDIDAAAIVAELTARPVSPRITIAHGSADKVLPVEMGRAVAAAGAGKAGYIEYPGVGHSEVLEKAAGLVVEIVNARE